MTAFIVAALFGPGVAPPPHWGDATREERAGVLAVAREANLYFPGSEFVGPDSFAGAVYLFRMRHNGTPLPWPDDPVLGQRGATGPWKDYRRYWGP